MLDFIPRKRPSEALHSGYRLLPGHEYRKDDYAILMAAPGASAGHAEDIEAALARFRTDSRFGSNKQRAAWRRVEIQRAKAALRAELETA